jgi:hypothetical protein
MERLFVPWPIGTYQGNQYDHGYEAHFSAVERVIMPTEDVFLGEYISHVIGHRDDFKNTPEFALAMSRSAIGPIARL